MRNLTGKVEAFATAKRTITPPSHIKLSDAELTFFDYIAKVKPDMTESDIVHACHLAQTFEAIERLTAQVREQGETYRKNSGDYALNPLCAVLDNKIKLSISLSRVLGIHALATKDARKLAYKNNQLRNAKQITDSILLSDDDDLLAH